MHKYIKITRPDHWIKQLFILPGVWLACVMVGGSSSAMWDVILALLSTSLAASANYTINEWLDAEFDKYHPVKKKRPCVTDDMDYRVVYLEYACLSVASLAVARQVNIGCLITIGLLLLMGIVYNVKPMRTKDIPYLDVLSESVNNALRFAIGWFCIAPLFYPPLSFVMGYWMVGAFLMAAKRFAEYRMIGNPEQAALYRKSFGRYSELGLLLISLFFGFLAVFFCGVFLIKYKIELIMAIPFICGLFCYYLRICFKPDSAAQKPEKLFHEKGLMIYVLLLIVMIVVLYHVNIPWLSVFLRTDLMGI